MKTISDYTIYCTPEQTRKALELGAPIIPIKSRRTKETVISKNVIEYDEHTFTYVNSPTAEQMLGWLEEQGVAVDICMASKTYGYYSIRRINDKGTIDFTGRCEADFSSHKETTLAAIDAALKYLNGKK